MTDLETYEPTMVTPRRIVRRSQAREVLRDLRRAGLRPTRRLIEYAALARYGGERGTGAVVREVTAAACEIADVEPSGTTRRVADRRTLLAMIADELTRDDRLLSREIRARIERRVRVDCMPSLFAAWVCLVRRDMGIGNPLRGRVW